MTREKETRTVINLKYIGVGLVWISMAIIIASIAAFAPQALPIATTLALCAVVATIVIVGN